jgi:hypothetical protein
LHPADSLQPAAVLCWPVLVAAAALLALGAKPATAAEPASAFDDPFEDALLDASIPPRLRKVSQRPTYTTYSNRFASEAEGAISDVRPRRPRFRPFLKVAQEVGWMTPAYAPPPRVVSVVDTSAEPSLGGETDVPAAEWHGLTLVTPPARKNVWLAYPVYLEKFAGAFLADEPIEGQLHNGVGFMAGLRTGWDYAAHWGVESRAAFARTQLGGPTLPTEAHENFVIWDAMWLWYPWANTTWRPFLLAGPGLTFVSFIDDRGQRLDQTFFHIPIGIGIKHRFGKQHAFRFDIVDDLLFDQLYPRSVRHQFSFVGGFEWRFGNPLPW